MRLRPILLGATISWFGCLDGSGAESSAERAKEPVPPKEEKESQWIFSLLPKSLQKNPRLEMTVITEMTEAGKKLPPVSADQPAYYEMHTSGPKHLGDALSGEFSLHENEIRPLLVRALRTNGYRPAERPVHPPSLLIIYTWGTHSMLREMDDENPALSANQIARNMLDRAALVGGDKFAEELLRLFSEADAMNIAARAPVPPDGEPVFTQAMMAFANPVEQFKRVSPKNTFLVDQTASDVYYITASAYDYASLTKNRRILLWRTRMTVAAAGVSQEQALPTLALTAAPYFGKEMAETEVLRRRVLPDGAVEVGTPTVIESDVSPPAAKQK